MNYIKSTLAFVTLFAIGSIDAMEKKQPQKKELKKKPSAEKVKATAPTPQKEYRQIYDQLAKLNPSVNDYFMLEGIQNTARKQAYEALKQEAKPSGNLTQQQNKELREHLKSEIDKNIDAIRNEMFPASTINDSITVQNIAKNCITKFPKIELGDFQSMFLEIFNKHPKNSSTVSGGRIEDSKRGTIAKAFFTAQKQLS